MRKPLVLMLLLSATATQAQPRKSNFNCTSEASAGGITARTQRLIDWRGDLREGTTSVDLPLTGYGRLEARWQVSEGLPEVARGKYLFRLPDAPDAQWQLALPGKPVRARNGALALSGEQFAILLESNAPIQLILTARDGGERGRSTIDRGAFEAALDLARQADARGLARAADYRSCERAN